MEPREVRIKLADKQEANKALFMEIYRMGKTPDPMMVFMLKLDTLIQCIMDEDGQNLFELAFEVELGKMLVDMKQQVSRSQLIVP